MRGILFLMQKELRQVLRSPAYLAFIFLAPFAMLLIMGMALTTEVKNIPSAVVDEDHSGLSRAIAGALQATPSFAFEGQLPSAGAATELMKEGRLKMALVIPPGFERDVITGRSPAVQLLVDGVDGNTAAVAIGYAEATLSRLQLEWAGRAAPAASAQRGASAMPLSSPMELGPTIRVVTRMWYNPNLQSRLNFVPGLLGILLVIVTTVVMSMNIVREKEIGTLEQVMVTPLSATQIITGKLVPFMLLGLGQFGVGVLATGVVFGIWATGSLLVLFVLAAVFCFSNLGLGLFISTVAKTQAEAMFIAWFFMIYSMILSGFFVPLENVPQFMRVVAAVNPLRYFIVVLREVYLEGAGFRYLWKEALAMGAIGMVTLMLAALRFRKRLS